MGALLLSQYGNYFLYRHQQHIIRREIKRQIFAGIPETALDVIEHNKELRWEEDGKEFHFGGEMYDIVKTKVINGKKIYYCIADKKEKKLIDNYGKSVNSTDDRTTNKQSEHSIKLQQPDYTFEDTEGQIFGTNTSLKKYFSFDDALLSSVKEIQAPPPKA